MKSPLSIPLLGVLLSVGTALSGQALQVRYETLSVEQGLSQSSVWCIAQDRQGFMWFGTADGLNRYDGYTFKVFRHNPTDSNSLSNNSVWSIIEDTNGVLWIGTSAGLQSYDKQTGKFVRVAEQEKYRNSRLTGQVTSLLQDQTGTIWIGSLTGLSVLNPATGSLTEYSATQFGFTPNTRVYVKPLYQDERGDIWLGCGDVLVKYDLQSHQFSTIPTPPSTKTFQLMFMFQTKDGTCWLGTGGAGLFSWDQKQGKWKRYSHDPNNPSSLGDDVLRAGCEDAVGRLWIGTSFSGVQIFDRESGKFTRFAPTSGNNRNAHYEGATRIVTDRSGLLWIGYDGAGIAKINPHTNKFHHILLPPSGSKSTGDNFFKSLIVDHSGAVWLGTYDQGIAVLDRKTGIVRRFSHNPLDPYSVRNNAVFTLLEDRESNVWAGTLTGLDEYNRTTHRFVHHEIPGLSLDDIRGRVITTLCEDSSGTIWVGTATQLLKFDATANKLRPVFSIRPPDSESLPAYFLCLLPAADSDLWAGTMGYGLVKLRPDGRVANSFKHDPSDTNSLSNNNVKAICTDPDGNLWIGTEEGLNRFDPAIGIWRRYHTRDGLPNDFIYGLLMDNHRSLWISTNRGLSKMDTRDYERPRFRNYTPDDGLQSYEFNTNVYFKTKDGEMFFGGVNGFNPFYPDSVRDNPTVPRVVLTGFKKFDRPFDTGSDIHTLQEVLLNPDETVFSFEFAALEFTNPSRNQYAYKMEGFDKDWIYCGTRREARYTHLDPGEYTFRVKGSNNDGVWNEQGASLQVIIVPPFWKTRWFLAGVVVVGGLLFGGGIRYMSTRKLRRTIARLEQERAIQEERLKTRERIARDLHDDLASTVGSAGFYIESVKRQLHDMPQQAKDFLNKTSSLLTEAEEAMSDIVWSVSPRHDTLESLLSRVRILTGDLCKANHIKYEVEFKGEEARVSMSDDNRRSIYLIFKEAITNAARHSQATLIRVRVEMNENVFTLHVQDDGKGMTISEDQPGQLTKRGHGLRNMRKRAEEISAELSIQSAAGNGTTICLSKRMTQMGH